MIFNDSILTGIQIASVERMKQQIKGPMVQSTLKRRTGYSDDNKRRTHAKTSTGNNEDMEISATGSQSL